MDQQPLSLEAVRARIDALDDALLRLIDERAGLVSAVSNAKRAAGEGDRFALRPAREARLLRRLLAKPRRDASVALTVRLWRELMSDSLARQGPFHLSVWGGRDPAPTVELARARFGAAPRLARAERPEDALAAARTPGGVAVLALNVETPWWGRLLAEPRLAVFATLPCLSVPCLSAPGLSASGALAALAVADVEIEPSGDDETYWVTDAGHPAAAIEETFSRDGVAARLLAQAGGLKLFGLAGFYQPADVRLARAPGALSGVIGAAARPFEP